MNEASEARAQPDIPGKFLKPYDPSATEIRIYKLWEESGFFNPDNLPERNQKGQPFSMVLPPPNVTGTLHLGHAFEDTIQDIVVRYKRMCGFKTVWIPGTDHAAIATQSKVEKAIQKMEGKSRHDLGREELLARVREFARASHDTIVSQIRTIGASIDWSREAFTLDEKRSLAVRTAFADMYRAGLIYRGSRVVNWDPKGQTTISDDEIEYEPRKAKLYTFKYAKNIPISVSTTRPETKLGDTAIAVHPDDERYKKYIGAEYDAVFAGEPIHLKVIADSSVDPAFGTGALGVTPAHSIIDWEMAQRHGLPLKQVINEFAKMTAGAEGVKGAKTAEAREAVVAWLAENGLLEKEEVIDQNISLAGRTGGLIEPLPKLQWFVAVNKLFDHRGRQTTLKELMKDAVASGAVKIIPGRFEKIYFNWIEHLRDWCISRQIWYGHRLPVWYKGGDIHVGTDVPPGDGWLQDEDTLDTWFSSGLWTFSTLGWPEKTKDLSVFHPTTFMCPGYEILFFWVARMILMSRFLLDQMPFETVYLHGIVRDAKGQKFSKSLNNGVDPIEMIERHGADALRMALIVGVGPGNDSKFDEQKVRGYKTFANKLWNITRFVLESSANAPGMEAGSGKEKFKPDFGDLTPADAEISERLRSFLAEISREMDEYKFYLVGEKLYHYIWHEFADKIIEDSKKILSEGGDAEKRSRLRLLHSILDKMLRALHPFMPYLTEEIWQSLGSGRPLLMVCEWPSDKA